MRFELFMLAATSFFVFNHYSDGFLTRYVLSGRKYYQMAGIALAGYVVYWLIKYQPEQAYRLFRSSRDYLSALPMDRSGGGIAAPNPVLDFSVLGRGLAGVSGDSRSQFQLGGLRGGAGSVAGMPRPMHKPKKPDGQAGQPGWVVKRAVSEAKRKWVAANQAWKCALCRALLPATYEVDHIMRLEYGGSNEVANLQALCPSCHRTKTMRETLGI